MLRCYDCPKRKNDPDCEQCIYSEPEANAPEQLPIGTILGENYIVGKAQGQGSFGITYIGWDISLKRRVAIKEYFPKNMVGRVPNSTDLYCKGDARQFQIWKERFLSQDARIPAKLEKSSEIVQIYQYLKNINNTAYIIMEYVDGLRLDAYIEQEGARLTPRKILRLLEPVAEALKKLHAERFVHLDVSPDNIMLRFDEAGHPHAMLLDFGSAQDLDKDGAFPLQVTFKEGFSPCEQHTCGRVGPWSDVYALCATLWFCMTGQFPENALSLQNSGRTLDWSQIPRLSKQQVAALQRGTAIEGKDRWQSIEALERGLNRALPAISLKTGILAVAFAALLLVLPSALPQSPSRNQVQTQNQTDAFPVMREDPVTPTTAEVTYRESVFGSALERQQIYAITVEKSLKKAPEDAWDISAAGDGSVLAWAEEVSVKPEQVLQETGDTPPPEELYHLHIAGQGGVQAPKNCYALFGGYRYLTKVELRYLKTDQTTNMGCMFYECKSLKKLDVSGFDTGKVEQMDYMFHGCTSLTKIDLSGFNTENVWNLRAMFEKCTSLTRADIAGFNTSKVTTVRYMFSQCPGMNEPQVGAWDIGKVTKYENFLDPGKTIGGKPWEAFFE